MNNENVIMTPECISQKLLLTLFITWNLVSLASGSCDSEVARVKWV